MELTDWIPTGVVTALVVIFRKSIFAFIEKGIQHNFDSKIETLRAELRSKESEISALRDVVLSGRANRQALLDERRIIAVERISESVSEFASYKFIAGAMAIIKLDKVSKSVESNPNLRKFFETISKSAPNVEHLKNPAKNEKPFVTPIIWALFSAYQAIIFHSYIIAKLLELGIGDIEEFVNVEGVKNILKAALPHQAQFIDSHDGPVHYYLLDELEEKLTNELRKMLSGVEEDHASISQSVKIMDEVKKVREETEKIAEDKGI